MAIKRYIFKRQRKRANWLRDQRGSSTIEFVMWFPLFMTLFMTSFELSFFALRSVFLERAVDMTVRDFRLGRLVEMDGDGKMTTADFKGMICENMLIAGTCEEDLELEQIRVSSSNWALPADSVQCIDRNEPIEPPDLDGFAIGGGGDLMLLRVCWQKKPFFSSTAWVMGIPRNPEGEIALIAMSTYVKEP